MMIKRAIMVITVFTTVVLAATICPAAILSVGNGTGHPQNTLTIDVSIDDPTGIAGAAFTIAYDTGAMTLTAINSGFFDTFANQWTQFSPPVFPPDSVDCGNPSVTYGQPLLWSESAGTGVRITAVRLKAATGSDSHTLFTLSFVSNGAQLDTAYPVSVIATAIDTTEAGYDSGGEAVPLLVGADPSQPLAGGNAFPVIMAASEVPGSIVAGSVTFHVSANDDYDGDGMPDNYESLYGFDPNDPGDADEDADGDGFTNLEEYHAGTSPRDDTLYPARPEVVECLPYENQGIDAESAGVPNDSSVNVRVWDGTGLDTSSLSISVTATGPPAETVAGTLFSTPVVESDVSDYWLTFIPDAVLEFDATFEVSVNAADLDGVAMTPYVYHFGVESQQAHDTAQNNAPAATLDDTDPDTHELSADTGTAIEGAVVGYPANEPVAPTFCATDGIPELDIAVGIGQPVCIAPPTVFSEPVTLIIPCPGVEDVSELSLYLYDPASGWVPACDAQGNVLPDADGWMVPGTRIDHNDGTSGTIEIRVIHAGTVQAGTDQADTETATSGGGGSGACFISILRN